jgi:pimeloyl-ACP methyl ester carboxylesterase
MERYLTYYAVKQLPEGTWTWKYDKLFRQPLMLLLKVRMPNLWHCLSQIKAPTLLLNGELSPVLKANVAEDMAKLIPSCKLVTFMGTGHRIHIEKPDEFEREVRGFLG